MYPRDFLFCQGFDVKKKTPESFVISGVHAPQLGVVNQFQPSSGGRTRTCDPTVNSRLLYQLSYAGKGPQSGDEKATQGGRECQRERPHLRHGDLLVP